LRERSPDVIIPLQRPTLGAHLSRSSREPPTSVVSMDHCTVASPRRKGGVLPLHLVTPSPSSGDTTEFPRAHGVLVCIPAPSSPVAAARLSTKMTDCHRGSSFLAVADSDGDALQSGRSPTPGEAMQGRNPQEPQNSVLDAHRRAGFSARP